MNKRKYLRRIGISILVLILSVGFLCLHESSPSASAEIAFRRLEKRNLIGPAEIIDRINFYYGAYDHIMIGRSEYGYTFYEVNLGGQWDQGRMTYIPKQEGATLYCTYNMYGSEKYSQDWLPIFAFTDHPAAVSAKLTLVTDQNQETVTYPLEAEKNQNGYFLFSWHTIGLRAEDFWLVQQLITGEYDGYVLKGSAQATLELYDTKGELLGTYLFTK